MRRSPAATPPRRVTGRRSIAGTSRSTPRRGHNRRARRSHAEQPQDRPGQRRAGRRHSCAGRDAPVFAPAPVVTSRPTALASASAATQRLTPRQPILDPTQAATGTPTSSVSDWPLMTQPSALPCCPAETRAGDLGEDHAGEHAAAAAGQAWPCATARKLSRGRDADRRKANASGPPIGRPSPPTVGAGARQHRAIPQAIEVAATRSATSGTLTERSRAMSIRNGARVVPLAAAVNIAERPGGQQRPGQPPGQGHSPGQGESRRQPLRRS